MRCPSCGATTNNNSEICIKCGPTEESISLNNQTQSTGPTRQSKSTLIEFPGVGRPSLPEWRKELSVRVREVQERKAREAAREAAEAQRQRSESDHTPQLELLPQAEAPAINPLVAAALKRIERANQSNAVEGSRHRVTAAAVAYAPSLEIHEPVSKVHENVSAVPASLTQTAETLEKVTPVQTRAEKTHLAVVPAVDSTTPQVKVEKPAQPKRLIVDDPNDPALNYLDSISRTLRVDEIPNQRASAFRRVTCAAFDLFTCVLLSSPIALALYWKGVDLNAIRPLIVLIGTSLILAFLYFTLSIGLTGRTWSMRLFSLRVVDRRTGLIPTGGQSAGRAFFYLVSLASAGLGILYALVSRDGETMHDRFTRTAVIKI